MEDIDRATEPLRRSLTLTAFGDTADEIELCALDEARPFFGDGVQLEVKRDYRARPTTDGQRAGVPPWPPASAGKKYTADVIVRVIEATP